MSEQIPKEVIQLLDKEIESENPAIRDLVDLAQGPREEIENISKQLAEGAERMEEMKIRRLTLLGEMQSYIKMVKKVGGFK